MSTITAVTADKVSLTGMDHHTPLMGSAKIAGSNKTSGIRYSTWRVRLKKIALPACPMDVNRFPVTI